MGEMRRDVALAVAGLLRGGKFPQGRGMLSQGQGKGRTYCGLGIIAETAVQEEVIEPATYSKERNRWLYGPYGAEFWLPMEVYQWAGCGPVGPELIVPDVSTNPVPMMFAADMGTDFNTLADALMNSVAG